jgi:2-keto-4-pentenoate hydratase
MSDLAKRLWQARVDGTVIDAATAAAPATLQDAYTIQDEIIRLLGHPVAAVKVGSTSKEAQRILGTTEPRACAVTAPYFYESPARIEIVPAQDPSIEGEFAFRLGRDLPPRDTPYRRDDVAEAVDAVAGAVEVVGTRLSGGLAGKGQMLTTADCCANAGLVVGAWETDWKALDLPAHRVAVRINDAPAGAGTGARALDDPMNVLVWLANDESKRGRGLTKGLCVSTGTCTGLDPVKPGDHVVADFGSLGTVAIDFA